jgi:hypothetical protein
MRAVDEKIYMNGVGIQERTRKLTAAAWDAVPGAFLGTAGGVVIAFLGIGIAFMPDGQTTTVDYIIAAVSVPVGVAALIYFSAPWHRAIRELNEHTAAMKRETEKYGKGWARS